MKIMLLALIALLIHPSIAPITAVDGQASLRVIVNDVSGNGLAGLDISIRAADDATLLAQSTTDSSGQALFTLLPVRAVRVRVSGQLSNTRILSQRGSDAEGVWLVPGVGDNALAFVVLADGRVELNPDGLLETDVSPVGQEISSSADMQTGGADVLQPEGCGAAELWSCGTAGSRRQADQLVGNPRDHAGQRAVFAFVLSILIAVLGLLVRGRRA